MQCTRVLNLPDINAFLNLTDEDFEEHRVLFTQTAIPTANTATPAQCRLVCYKMLFRLLNGVGVSGLKVVLPSCCRAVIDAAHPDVQ